MPFGMEGSPLKVHMQCSFENTFDEFLAWVDATFQNPNALPLTVAVGNKQPTPGKPNLYCTFEGSIEQFCAFMQDTFKNPGMLNVAASVGGGREPEKTAPTRLDVTGVPDVLQRYVQSKQLKKSDAIDIARMWVGGNKLWAIKTAREKIPGLGLKEAKELVESITKPEEIPF